MQAMILLTAALLPWCGWGRTTGTVGVQESSAGRGQAARAGDQCRDGKVSPWTQGADNGRHKLPLSRRRRLCGLGPDLGIQPGCAAGERG